MPVRMLLPLKMSMASLSLEGQVLQREGPPMEASILQIKITNQSPAKGRSRDRVPEIKSEVLRMTELVKLARNTPLLREHLPGIHNQQINSKRNQALTPTRIKGLRTPGVVESESSIRPR